MPPSRPHPSARRAPMGAARPLAVLHLALGLALAPAGGLGPGPAAAAVQGLDLALPPPSPDTSRGAEADVPGGAPEHLETLKEAAEASFRRDFAAARPLWERVVVSNPYRSSAWLELAEARAFTGDMDGGMEALERAVGMGLPVPRGRVFYEVALAMAGAGQGAMAVVWLERALAAGFGDRAALGRSEAFAGLRGTAAFDSLVGAAPPAEDRVAGWRWDIDFLVSEARRMHPSPERPAHGEHFRALADSLKAAAAAGADDDALAMGLSMLAAALGDGHSWVAPRPAGADSPAELRAGLLPVRPYVFRDGIYVVDGKGEAERWIGMRITEVGGRPVEEVLRDLAPFVSRDNAMGMRSSGAGLYLRHIGALRAAGAADGLDAASLTLSGASGLRRVTLAGGSHGFERALPPPPDAGVSPPLWLSDPGTNYWMEALPNHGALYVQFNSVRDREEGPSVARFARAVRDSLESSGARGLVLDLRWNGGGNNGLLRPLIRQLVGWETAGESGEGRQIVVLAGRHTFSAAQNLANRLERWTDAVFVGEPTGSRPNVAGEHTELVLPWSGLRASISNRYWQDSDPGDDRPWIAPDVRAEPTAADYFAGRDPALEAALELLSAEAGAAARR